MHSKRIETGRGEAMITDARKPVLCCASVQCFEVHKAFVARVMAVSRNFPILHRQERDETTGIEENKQTNKTYECS